MTSKVTYNGRLRTDSKHNGSGYFIMTDAALGNHGLGQVFPSTDTDGMGLGSCMFSLMGIKARGLEMDMEYSSAIVVKRKGTHPRRIAKIDTKFNTPKINSDKHGKTLKHMGSTFPVHISLHPEIVRNINFHWEL